MWAHPALTPNVGRQLQLLIQSKCPQYLKQLSLPSRTHTAPPH